MANGSPLGPPFSTTATAPASRIAARSSAVASAVRQTIAAPPPGPSTQERYRQAAEAVVDGYLEHYPTSAVELGLHQYDGKLPDMTAEGIKARSAWLAEQLAGWQKFLVRHMRRISFAPVGANNATQKADFGDLLAGH